MQRPIAAKINLLRHRRGDCGSGSNGWRRRRGGRNGRGRRRAGKLDASGASYGTPIESSDRRKRAAASRQDQNQGKRQQEKGMRAQPGSPRRRRE